MGWGFPDEGEGQGQGVSLDILQEIVRQRIEGIYKNLGGSGLNRDFSRASLGGDPAAETGFTSNVLMDMFMWGPFFSMMGWSGIHHAIGGNETLSDSFNGASVVSFTEGVSIIADERAYKFRASICSDYQKGRNNRPVFDPSLKKKFNLTGANQNFGFGGDVRQELAALYDVLDLLDELKKHGATMLKLDTQKPVHKSLKAARKSLFNGGALNRYAIPMRVTI